MLRLCLLAVTVAIVCVAVPLRLPAFSHKNNPPPVLRWAEDQPGCTFSRDNDGKYRYALWTDDYGVILAVDSQELEKIRRRVEPFFSVQLTVRYRGKATLSVAPGKASLEFVRHFKVTQSALRPGQLAQKTRADADEIEDQIKHEIQKHPERKDEQERLLQDHQTEVTAFLGFLNRSLLPPTDLDADHAEVRGWVLFSTQNKWLGDWKKPEEFVLRLPLADRVLEFPFSLPAKEGDLILRKRPN
jgi:hypothetical protein